MKHHPTPKGWPARLVAVPLGALAAVAGLEGLAHGWFWYVGYDAVTGTFGIAPTLWLVIAGVGLHCRRWGWLQAIRQPLDIYFASWKTPQDPKASKGDPIGYFMFIDEGFRWESDIQFVKPRISNLKVVPAKMVKKVDPVYPSEAAAQHVSGTRQSLFCHRR